LNSNLGLARNEALFLTDRGVSQLYFHNYWGHISSQSWMVIFNTYTWNFKGNLRKLKRPPFRGIELLFLFLWNHED
jgi:hypothetical protein